MAHAAFNQLPRLQVICLVLHHLLQRLVVVQLLSILVLLLPIAVFAALTSFDIFRTSRAFRSPRLLRVLPLHLSIHLLLVSTHVVLLPDRASLVQPRRRPAHRGAGRTIRVHVQLPRRERFVFSGRQRPGLAAHLAIDTASRLHRRLLHLHLGNRKYELFSRARDRFFVRVSSGIWLFSKAPRGPTGLTVKSFKLKLHFHRLFPKWDVDRLLMNLPD